MVTDPMWQKAKRPEKITVCRMTTFLGIMASSPFRTSQPTNKSIMTAAPTKSPMMVAELQLHRSPPHCMANKSMKTAGMKMKQPTRSRLSMRLAKEWPCSRDGLKKRMMAVKVMAMKGMLILYWMSVIHVSVDSFQRGIPEAPAPCQTLRESGGKLVNSSG